jgi:hypothetical protein
MEECKDAKGDAEVGGELPIAKTDIGVAELQLLVLLAYLRSQKPNSLTYNFCWGFRWHHLGTNLRFPHTMFTLQTVSKHFCSREGGVKSVSRGDCE